MFVSTARAAAVLLPLLVALSACAPINGRPNGWAMPGDFQPGPHSGRTASGPSASEPRAEARPRREETRREDARLEEATPAVTASYTERRAGAPAVVVTASGLAVPVAAITPEDLSDSFHSPRSGGRTHHAIDIGAPTGTPILAATDGEVVRKHWNALGGRTLYLRSADGRYDFYYAHLDSYADGVEVGTRVRRGDVLGTVGSTGNARSPHLHFQVLDLEGGGRGAPVNPYDLLRGGPALSP